MDTHKTQVIFRKEKDGEIIAVFPYLIYQGVFITCYAHVGQHSSMDWNYFDQTKPATEDEYKDLQKELTNIGYNLDIIKRRSFKKYLEAYKKYLINLV